jgi:cyclic pyranopterin phosphate synthase
MVDVAHKEATVRTAVASASVWMLPETFARIDERSIAKGDVLQVARLAGIMAAKKTPDLIPLCHPLPIDAVSVDFTPCAQDNRIDITATVRVGGKTGVEMEALTAVSVAALTIYDMCKAVDKKMKLGEIKLLRKEGGKSGLFVRDE